jgi:hypothetical protein
VALISLVSLVALVAFAPAVIAGPQKGREKHGQDAKSSQAAAHAVPRAGGAEVDWRHRHDAWNDRDHCVVVVHDYYDRRDLPPGLAKKHSLPPGLAKQLHERGHLPPGLEKHWVLLPEPLERELPPLPPHHVRRIVGADLLVVDLRLNIVVSLWRGVL